MGRRKRIAIIGAGIGGLTAATDLCDSAEKNGTRYKITVYDSRPIAGGKAYGYLSGRGRPVEHSLRVLLVYEQLFAYMRRIPCAAGRTAFDNLVPNKQYEARHGKFSCGEAFEETSLSPCERLGALVTALQLFRFSCGDAQLLLCEFAKYVALPCYRRHLETVSFEDALLTRLSAGGRDTIKAFAEILVAARPETVAIAMYQVLFDVVGPGWPTPKGATRNMVLAGPTSDTFIEPWVAWLRSRGVRFELGCAPVARTRSVDRHQTSGPPSFEVRRGRRKIRADAYLFAVSLSSAHALFPDEVLPPSSEEEWSNGMQFYLSGRPACYPGAMRMGAVLDSPWRLVVAVQDSRTWPQAQLDPSVGCTVSATYSNDTAVGKLVKKTVRDCTRDEFAR